jgi:hypothetical protein
MNILQIPLGTISERIGRRKVLALGLYNTLQLPGSIASGTARRPP